MSQHPAVPAGSPAPALRLGVHVTPDDVAEVQRCYLGRSPTQRRALRVTSLAAGALVLLTGVLASLAVRSWWLLAVLAVVAPLVGLWVRRVTPRNLARQAVRQALEGRGSLVLGPCTYELRDGRLLVSRPSSGSWVSVAAIQDVVRTPLGCYVFVGPAAAWPIPQHRVTEGDHAAFVHALERSWARPGR